VQRVGVLIGRVVAAAESGERGWIVPGRGGVFGREVVESGKEGGVRGEQRAADTEADTVQEVAPRDAASHPEIAVVVLLAHELP
jgi:hypothetical protein